MENKQQVISKLRQELLGWEGYKAPIASGRAALGLGPLENAFPDQIFPQHCVHELVCASSEQAAASGGFVTGILSTLIQKGGVCIWIGRARHLFAPALATFGVAADRVIFISLYKDKDTLWVMEEALKCPGLTAVVGELREMDFKQSRRFQLAVENSKVTGFILRNAAGKLGSTACAARWQVRSLPSTELNGLPGLGFLRWQVDLLKVRNGHTGSFQLEWREGKFRSVEEITVQEERQAG
jgi:protein ImuA